MIRTIGVLFFVIFVFVFSQTAFAQNLADVPLDPQYCDEEYYSIPGEPARCSRAPEACGNGYDQVNTQSLMPDPQDCTSNPNACGGKPPLCCYEMARTGDFTKCVGYWERLWCPQVLCDQAKANGASDSQCGGSCQCSHAFTSYCGDNVQIIPMSQRIAGITAPANTPTPTTPAGATATPTTPAGATATPTTPAGQPTATPTTSATSCETQRKQGDFNCSGGVDEADFTAWKESYVAKSSTLSFFEYWRRASLQ